MMRTSSMAYTTMLAIGRCTYVAGGSSLGRIVDIATIFAVKLVSMFTRTLQPPKRSFFLFGPRGTGKSTWLREHFPDALTINLLTHENIVRFERDPSLLRGLVTARPTNDWVVLDEVQRVPKLLDEVHYLMEEEGHTRFALTGSSARSLRRGGVNLLAGRAVIRNLLPLTTAEMEHSVPIDRLARFGSLPISVLSESDEDREDFLRAYVTTYLAEEIKAEGLVRDLGAYSRFLAVAALTAGQRTNVSGLARDAGVARDTTRGYFDVLVDTLMGGWLPAYRPRARVKEVALPKFYWFDAGVLNAAAGGFDQPLPADWTGVLLEHVIHHELRAYLHYSSTRGSLGYWATPSGTEVDFVWWHGTRMIAIEVKAAARFRSEFTNGIRSLRETHPDSQGYVVYRGSEELLVDDVRVLPVEAFLRTLHAGEVLV